MHGFPAARQRATRYIFDTILAPIKDRSWPSVIATTVGIVVSCLGSPAMAVPVDVVIEPTADAYTQQNTPTTNYGTETTVLVRQDAANALTRAGYFEFNLGNVFALNGTVTAARLEVFGSHDQGGTGVTIKAIGGIPAPNQPLVWSETSLNFNNAQTLTGVDLSGPTLSTTVVSPPPAKLYSWDVKSFVAAHVNAHSHVTVALAYTAPNTYRSTFNSKEAAANKPRLVVTVDIPPPTTITLSPVADTYTQQNTPTTNYGIQPAVLIRQDVANALTRGGYFEFDLSGLPSGMIVDAKLKLFGSQDQGGTGTTIMAVGGTANTPWSETALNYNNAQALTGLSLAGPALSMVSVMPPPAKFYDWDVKSYIISRRYSGTGTIGLGYTDANTYRSTFNSKEAATNKPQLVVSIDTRIPPPQPPQLPPDQLPGSCPNGYVVQPGLNTNFLSGGVNRAFVLNLPTDVSTRRPVWVPLTGPVESTNENLDARGGNRLMTSEGFIVIGPVRKCAGQDPNGASTSVSGGACNQAGSGGWVWNAWNDGRVFGVVGDVWKTNEGDDSRFLEAVVRCVANTYLVDGKRIFLGGILNGGTMTNRALAFNSDFWAGGEPISGEWYVTKDDGTSYTTTQTPDDFTARRAAVAANPTKIFQGRVGPYPLYNTLGNTEQLSPMIVITLWGGPNDMYNCGGVVCIDNRQSTQAGSNYFSAQPNVVHVACSSHHGLQWPTIKRDAWNRWVLRTLASHPKGTPKSAFVLPPMTMNVNGTTVDLSTDYNCVVGPYTDHY